MASCTPPKLMEDYLEYYVRRVQYVQAAKEHAGEADKRHNECLRTCGENSLDGTRKLSEQFAQLRAEMLDLMEGDVKLMRQLLALNESVAELKTLYEDECTVSPASSCQSLVGEEDLTLSRSASFMKQYFSRQNSVLRIPIAPARHRPLSRRVASEEPDGEQEELHSRCPKLSPDVSSPESSCSSQTSGLCSDRGSGDDDTSSVCCTSRKLSDSAFSVVDEHRCGHQSQASFDSGIHSPNTDDHLEVFV